MSILRVENLWAGYGNHVVLRGVSFDVLEKEILGVIGPNGSGKSTLVRAITGLIPSSGNICYGEEELSRFSRRFLARKIAVVSQSVLRPSMRVWQYLLMGRYPYHDVWDFRVSKSEQEFVKKLADEFGVNVFLDRFLSELSGGEFQLTQIVRALVQEPSLLIMDEPTAHLDIHYQVTILDWLEALKNKIAVMIVMHDINLASLYCDRVMMLKSGKVEVIDSPEKAFTYDRLERVFNVPVVVYPSPMEKRPHAYLVPRRFLKEKKDE